MFGTNAKRKSFRLLCVFTTAMVFLVFSATALSAQTLDSLQRNFSEQRFGMFIHFNMNTYVTGWANSRANPLKFNPTNLNCAQWASTAKAAGMKYGVLTCKHHDGFPIWQTKVPPLVSPAYSIAQSSQPTMDVVKSYTDAFRAAGLGPGLYMSMWDVAQNIPQDIKKWTPAQRTYILGQIHELLSNYGPIPLFFFDGYSWAMGHWAVPWQEIRDTIKALQPNCLIAETNGMNEPWETDLFFIEEPTGLWCPPGNTYAAIQAPTILGGGAWFWNSKATSISNLSSVDNIVTTHLKALEPLYCNVQLNCPPNQQGQFDQAIVDRLTEVGKTWKPNTARPPLPTQFPLIEDPITPVSATATSGTAFNAIDDVNDLTRNSIGHYQTLWQSAGNLPQSITIDLGAVYNNINMLYYLPKRDSANGPVSPNGYITGYKLYVSTDGTAFTQISTGTAIGGGTFGTWAANSKIKRISFATQSARYVKFEATAASGGSNAIISSISVGGAKRGVPVANKFLATATASPQITSEIRTAFNHINFSQELLGKEKQITVYDLGGKLLAQKTTNKNNADLRKDFQIPDGVHIVKVHTLK